MEGAFCSSFSLQPSNASMKYRSPFKKVATPPKRRYSSSDDADTSLTCADDYQPVVEVDRLDLDGVSTIGKPGLYECVTLVFIS